MKRAVESGAADSQNAFVERAILRELQEIRKARIYAAYAEAASDATFMAGMNETTNAFDASLSDGLQA